MFPFILRGINLLGIESVMYPIEQRCRIWQRIATDLRPAGLMDQIAVETDLDGLPDILAKIVKGQTRGRVLVRL